MCIHTSKNNMMVCRDLTCLVDSNEPVPCKRGFWGEKEVWNSNHHTAPWNYEDTNNVVERAWHTKEDFVEMSPHIGDYSDDPSNVKHFVEEFEPTFESQPSQKEKEHRHMENGVPCLGLWEKGGSNYHTAPCYRCIEDENKEVVKSCHTVKDEIMSPDSLSITVESQCLHLNHSNCHNDLQTQQNSIESLKNNINSLTKKIKNYEEKFETDFGYRPSHSEMRKNKDIKKYWRELTKSRKELKQMKNSVKGLVSISSAQELTTAGSQTINSCQRTAAAAITLQQVEESLKQERFACGRKENMADMTLDELQEEKTSLQKAQLYYESTHGRPKSTEDRDLAKPLYDRYRQCKRYVLRAQSLEKENIGDLAPIIEHETMLFTQVSPLLHDSIYQPTVEEDTFFNPPQLIDKEVTSPSLPLGDLHSLPLHDLKTRKKDVKEEKKRLRKTICDFEEQFERENGRKFLKEDRAPLEQTYLDYRYLKAKLSFIKALLTKLQPIRY